MSLWLIGGMDPTGGAGVLRDYWAARARAPALGPACAVTALTKQGRGGSRLLAATPADRMVALLARMPTPGAIKVGLVPNSLVDVIGEALKRRGGHVVLDPVLRASDGGQLGSSPQALVRLAARAKLVTPNVDEAVAMTGAARNDPALAERVLEMTGAEAVLLKNRTGAGGEFVEDRLVTREEQRDYRRRRSLGPDPRGTGCTLATVIAVHLWGADFMNLPAAVEHAIEWLDEARTRLRTGPDGRPHMV